MSNLYDFAIKNPEYVDKYTTRCDVLKTFAKLTGQP